MFFYQSFCSAFKNSKSFICAKPLSINLSGVREWSRLYPFIEIVRLPEALDFYRSQGLNFFSMYIQKTIRYETFLITFSKYI